MTWFWKICIHDVRDHVGWEPEIEAKLIGFSGADTTPEPTLPRASQEFYLVPERELVAIEREGLVYSDLVPKVAELLKRNAGGGSRDYNDPVSYFYEDARDIVNLFAQTQGRMPSGVQRFLEDVNAAKEAGEQYFQADPDVWYGGPPEKTEPRQA